MKRQSSIYLQLPLQFHLSYGGDDSGDGAEPTPQSHKQLILA